MKYFLEVLRPTQAHTTLNGEGHLTWRKPLGGPQVHPIRSGRNMAGAERQRQVQAPRDDDAEEWTGHGELVPRREDSRSQYQYQYQYQIQIPHDYPRGGGPPTMFLEPMDQDWVPHHPVTSTYKHESMLLNACARFVGYTSFSRPARRACLGNKLPGNIDKHMWQRRYVCLPLRVCVGSTFQLFHPRT